MSPGRTQERETPNKECYMKFSSRPLPAQFGAFLEDLHRAHNKEPFPPLPENKNPFKHTHRRIKEIAATYGIEERIVAVVGDLCIPKRGFSVYHEWFAYESESGSEQYVIDPHFPLHEDEFIDKLGAYMTIGAPRKRVFQYDLAVYARQTSFDKRVFGEFPNNTFEYIGVPERDEGSAFHFRPQSNVPSLRK